MKLLALVLVIFAAGPASLPDVEDEVMCVECGTVLNISNSPVADQERALIRRQIAQGRDKEEIKAALVAEYGEGVLATPGGDGFDLAAYLLPALAVLAGASGIAFATVRWRRSRSRALADGEATATPASDDEKRLERDLERYDL